MTDQLTVTGMTCRNCESTLRDVLADLPGVEAVEADARSETVFLCGDPDLSTARQLIDSLGYGVEG